MNDYKLDNPVWYSLAEAHKEYAINHSGIKFYHPDYCPFGGIITTKNIEKPIVEYATLADSFFIVGHQPKLPSHLVIKKELVCLQMVIHNKIDIPIKDHITPLTPEHAPELFDLVTLVQPGYFRPKTRLLGSYYGIFKNGQLVSVTGERLKMNDFTEVSAVVTHPDHLGQGYAKQLIAHTVNNLFHKNSRPYLHVAATNSSAIGLYEKLGFTKRREISFWNISQ